MCATAPECCDEDGEWDQSCADLAWELCPELPGCQPPPDPACGDAGTGDCCTANGSPFCEDADCCATVCDIDPYCCDTEGGVWDACCAELAAENCPHPDWTDQSICDPPPMCGPDSGACGEVNGTPGCNDPHCCVAVCNLDPFCCDQEWDELCVNAMCDSTECDGCDCPWIVCDPICAFTDPEGNCFEPGGTGCYDFECCELVCACDPFCCFTEWDKLCVGPNTETGCSAVNLCCHLHECNPADLTLDNIVGVPDLLILLANWGECDNFGDHCPDPADCPIDFTGDQQIGIPDLLFMLNNWGE